MPFTRNIPASTAGMETEAGITKPKQTRRRRRTQTKASTYQAASSHTPATGSRATHLNMPGKIGGQLVGIFAELAALNPGLSRAQLKNGFWTEAEPLLENIPLG